MDFAKLAKQVAGIGLIGGATLTLNALHVSASEFHDHLAQQRVKTILDYREVILKEGPQPWLCRAIEDEFFTLCTDAPNHALCKDKDEIMKKTGCP